MTLIRAPRLKQATLFSIAGASIYGFSLILMDIVIAQRYGTGTQAAVYQAAYMIPTLLIAVFSGGAIIGAYIPIFIRLGGPLNQPEASEFLRSSAGLLLTVLTPLTAALIWSAPLLAETIASGFSPVERHEVTNTLRLMLPMLVPHAVSYVYYSSLVSAGRVGVANLLPLLIPASGLATYPWWGEHNGAELIAVGYSLGAILLALATGWRLRRTGLRVIPTRPSSSPDWKNFLHGYLTTGLALAALSVLFLISQIVAAGLSARDMAVFSFGTKLILLALAFFTTIVNSVALPHFSSLIINAGRAKTWLRMRYFLLLAFVLASLGTAMWVFLSDWIVSVIYASGEFSNADSDLVASVQRAFVLQIPFYVIGIFCWRMFNALEEWKPLLFATLPALVVNAAVATPLGSEYQATGIAAGYTLSIAVWALILLITLRRKLTALPGQTIQPGELPIH